MFYSTFIILTLCQPTTPRSIFDNLPPIIEDVDHQHHQSQAPDSHQFLFNQISKYATEAHYMHFRLPIHLNPLFQIFTSMKTALNDTTNLPHGKAMGPVLAFVNTQAQIQIGIVENNLKQLELNMPLAPENVFFHCLHTILLTLIGASEVSMNQDPLKMEPLSDIH